MSIIEQIRPHFSAWKPYSSARSEFKGSAQIFLDANESPYPDQFHRYPDPLQKELRKELAKLNDVNVDQVFLGNGSDEVLDLIIRLFCEPGKDWAVTLPPTYGMYQVLLSLNQIEVCEVPLSAKFDINTSAVLDQVEKGAKIVFICSPNNPTGNQISIASIQAILRTGVIVVLDQAYIEFAGQNAGTLLLREFQNLIITQTLSKAYGLAGLRIGLGLAHPDVVALLNAIKPPYNISSANAQWALEAVSSMKVEERINETLYERERLTTEINKLEGVKEVFPSSANFLLVRFSEAQKVFVALRAAGIIVRDRTNQLGCADCLRITVGTPQENTLFIEKIKTLAS